jgi:hypothetical protein
VSKPISFIHFLSRSLSFIFKLNMYLLAYKLLLRLYSPLLGLCRFFSFLILYNFGRTPWTGISPSQGRYLHTEQHKHRINIPIQTSMPSVVFSTTIPASEREKTVHALDSAATVVALACKYLYVFSLIMDTPILFNKFNK